jgi:hypothetical protein
VELARLSARVRRAIPTIYPAREFALVVCYPMSPMSIDRLAFIPVAFSRAKK